MKVGPVSIVINAVPCLKQILTVLNVDGFKMTISAFKGRFLRELPGVPVSQFLPELLTIFILFYHQKNLYLLRCTSYLSAYNSSGKLHIRRKF